MAFGSMEAALQSGVRAAPAIVKRSIIDCPGEPMRAEAEQQTRDPAA